MHRATATARFATIIAAIVNRETQAQVVIRENSPYMTKVEGSVSPKPFSIGMPTHRPVKIPSTVAVAPYSPLTVKFPR